MILAYIDETGEPGAYVGPDHSRYKTSAAFGYAGFVVPEAVVRDVGARFQCEKLTLFSTEIGDLEHPGRWERKGTVYFVRKHWSRFRSSFAYSTGLLAI